jgi:hypothetical protein
MAWTRYLTMISELSPVGMALLRSCLTSQQSALLLEAEATATVARDQLEQINTMLALCTEWLLSPTDKALQDIRTEMNNKWCAAIFSPSPNDLPWAHGCRPVECNIQQHHRAYALAERLRLVDTHPHSLVRNFKHEPAEVRKIHLLCRILRRPLLRTLRHCDEIKNTYSGPVFIRDSP